MNMAVDQIQVLKDQNKTFNIFSVPRTTVLCEDVLEKERLAHCTYFSSSFPYLKQFSKRNAVSNFYLNSDFSI